MDDREPIYIDCEGSGYPTHAFARLRTSGQWCDEHLCDRVDCDVRHSAPPMSIGWQDPPFNDEGGTW